MILSLWSSLLMQPRYWTNIAYFASFKMRANNNLCSIFLVVCAAKRTAWNLGKLQWLGKRHSHEKMEGRRLSLSNWSVGTFFFNCHFLTRFFVCFRYEFP